MIRKLLIIIMGIFLVICAGACNIYPLYLKTMMTKFNFSLKEVNLYGTFINLGLWVAFPMGWIYDKYGPKISCIIGCFFLSGSYIILYLLLNSDIVSISILPFLVIALMMGQGSALCFTTSLTTNLKNFRFKESSVIVGLLTAQVALSPSVFTTYREAMKDLKISKYFIIISIFIITVISVCVVVFRNIKRIYNEDEDKKTYEKYKERKIIKLIIFLNIIILIVYTFGIIFNAAIKSDTDSEANAGSNKFPLVIVYPCLQMFNFVIVILEIYGVFDKIYFKPYIDKMIIKQLTQEKIREIRNEFANNEFKGKINLENEAKEGRKGQILGDDVHKSNVNQIEKDVSDVNKVNKIDGEFVEIEMDANFANKNKFVGDNCNSDAYDTNDKNSTDKFDKSDDNDHEKKVISQLNIEETIRIESGINTSNQNNHSIGNNSNSNNMYIGNTGDKKEKILLTNNLSDKNLLDVTDRNIAFKDAVLSRNVIILFVILILGIGSVISNLNNIEFIITSITIKHSSLSYTATSNTNNSTNTTDTFAIDNTNATNAYITPTSTSSRESGTHIVIYSYVILYFVFNAFSKIMSGLVIDYLIKIRKFVYYLVFVSAIGLISQFTGIFLNKDAMLISVSLAGMTHGGYATFLPVFVRNEFGLAHMGKILGVLTSGQAVGSLLIADFMFIAPYNFNSVDGECYGTKCFRWSYILTTIFFTVNLVLSIIMLRNYLSTFKKLEIHMDKSNGQIENTNSHNA